MKYPATYGAGSPAAPKRGALGHGRHLRAIASNPAPNGEEAPVGDGGDTRFRERGFFRVHWGDR
jgi:hypothetical protein